MPLQKRGRHGPGRAELEDAHPILGAEQRDGLAAVERAGAAGDDQEFRPCGSRIGVERARLEDRHRLPELFLLETVLLDDGGADHRPALGIGNRSVAAKFGLPRRGRQRSEDDVSAGVRHPGDAAEHDDVPDLLREVEGPAGHLLRLLEVRRFEQRDLHQPREMAGFALVDAGERPGIVAGDEDHPAPRSRPGQVEEKIGGDVDAVLLHDAERPESREGCRGSNLHGHLFVGGPLHVELSRFREPGECFDDLRRRGAGITGGDPHPGLQGAAGDRLVPHEQDLGPLLLFDESIASRHQPPPLHRRDRGTPRISRARRRPLLAKRGRLEFLPITRRDFPEFENSLSAGQLQQIASASGPDDDLVPAAGLSHPSGRRADPTERSLNSAVMSPQERQEARTQGFTSSSETGTVPSGGVHLKGMIPAGRDIHPRHPGEIGFSPHEGGEFPPGEGPAAEEPDDEPQLLDAAVGLPLTGWVRILARANAWQGVATTPIRRQSVRTARLNSATVGETTKRLFPMTAAASGSRTVMPRGRSSSPSPARTAASMSPSRRARTISAVTVPPCCARRRIPSSVARVMKNPSAAPSSGVTSAPSANAALQGFPIRRRLRAEGITASPRKIAGMEGHRSVPVGGLIGADIDAGAATGAETGLDDPFLQLLLPSPSLFPIRLIPFLLVQPHDAAPLHLTNLPYRQVLSPLAEAFYHELPFPCQPINGSEKGKNFFTDR